MKKLSALILSAAMLAAFACPASADIIKMDIPYQNTDPGLYLVELDLTNQVGAVYMRDEFGSYGNVVRQFLITSGDAENSTPTGTFKLTEMRERFGYFLNFNIYAQYWTQVVRGIYLHSVLFSRRNDTSMTRGSYNELGKAASHGCVRMLVEDARFIFYNCPPGTTIKITKKALNPELTQSLKPKASASKYKFAKDELPSIKSVTAFVLNNNVPMRTGFSLGAHEIDSTVATLSAGDEIEILQSGNSWVKARFGKKEGYIQTKHVRAADSSDSPQTFSRVAVQSANVYVSGSNTAAVIGTLPYGTAVTLLEDSFNYFMHVEVNGLTGYILKTDLISAPMIDYGAPSDMPTMAEDAPTRYAVGPNGELTPFGSVPIIDVAPSPSPVPTPPLILPPF